MTPYGNSPVEKKRGCEPPRVATPVGSPPAQKIGRPALIATSAVLPSPARSIAHTTRSIASSNTKHRAVTRPMLRSSSHVDQTSLGPALVDSIRISAPQCKKPRGLSHSGLQVHFSFKTGRAHDRRQDYFGKSENVVSNSSATSGSSGMNRLMYSTTFLRSPLCRSKTYARYSIEAPLCILLETRFAGPLDFQAKVSCRPSHRSATSLTSTSFSASAFLISPTNLNPKKRICETRRSMMRVFVDVRVPFAFLAMR